MEKDLRIVFRLELLETSMVRTIGDGDGIAGFVVSEVVTYRPEPMNGCIAL